MATLFRNRSDAQLEVMYVPIERIKPNPRNARAHPKSQIEGIKRSITEFGFTNPILVDENFQLIAGHGRLEATRQLGTTEIPVIVIRGLSPAQARALMLADNKIAEGSSWDQAALQVELGYLVEIGFDVGAIGFEVTECDLLLQAADERTTEPDRAEQSPMVELIRTATSRMGDHWYFGGRENGHALIVGDARDSDTISTLMDGRLAAATITDMPYNLKISGVVSGKGRHKHGEFAMASGEMSDDEFVKFQVGFLSACLKHHGPGAIMMCFIDWRHLFESLTAARSLKLELINLVVWNKTNGGMGSLYRSKHELVMVFRVPGKPHRNNVALGKNGRNRTNVWDYAGVNTFKKGRGKELAMHPTVKPVAMIADAMRDVTKQGDIVLDPFGGSGTALIAAEKTGRRARLIEIDPHYCDVIIRRWQDFTGKGAVLATTGETFEDVTARRAAETLTPEDLP